MGYLQIELGVDDIGALSQEDLERYRDVIESALQIHVDREQMRRGLWKQYSARDQVNTAKTKLERVLHSLTLDATDPQLVDNAVEELYDIINYSVFAVRILKGRDGI